MTEERFLACLHREIERLERELRERREFVRLEALRRLRAAYQQGGRS